MSDEINKENETNLIQKVKVPKWHRIYYLLAIFDVVVVIFGLYLNHQIIGIQHASVSENQAWSKRLENYLELSEMAAMVNAPGNDVFDSQDYSGESKKMELELAKFNRSMKLHYENLDYEVPSQYTNQLRADFDKINTSMSEMTQEARLIFSYFSQKKPELAGRRMAEMDRKYFRLNSALTELRRDVMGIQQNLLAKQAEDANFLRRFEIVSAAFILLMVGAASFYGNKIKQQMEKSSLEKEIFISELQSAKSSLQEYQDELELKVEQRTLELTQAKEFTDNIISSMADMLIMVNDKGLIINVNEALLKQLGYHENEVVGKPLGFLTQTNDFLTKAENKKLKAKKKLVEVEKEFIKKNGKIFTCLISVSILKDFKRAAVVVAKDLSQRIEEEVKLKQYADRLKQSNSELLDFAYVASHDLQEPLRKVQAFGDRLSHKYGEKLGEEGNDYVRRMKEATSRMQTLIIDLLAFSRVTTKAQPFQPIDVREITKEVISDLEIRIEETKGKVEIGDLPQIDADPTQIRQLLQNLIGNALKFHRPNQSPIIKVYSNQIPQNGAQSFNLNGQSLLTQGLGDKFCQIVVQDNGIGFNEKYLDRIFAVFQRLHGRNEYEGSGVGLAVCRKIVERHQGTITAKSKEGEGAAFIITLPLRQPIKISRSN